MPGTRHLSFKYVMILIFTVIAAQSARADNYVPGELIIKYKGKKFSNTSKAASQKLSAKGLKLKSSWSGMNMQHFAAKPGQSVEAAINEALQDPDIEYAEPNYYLQKATLDKPSEILTKSELQSEVQAQALQYSQTDAPVNIPEAWSQMSPVSYKPIVAIIDTGIDLQHMDLQDSLWVNTGEVAGNGVDDDGNGYVDDINGWNFFSRNNNPDDCDGHGTHVAGIVRGATQDILASTLATPKIRLMAIKFLDCNGYGSTSDAIQGIYYAVNNGAKVLNNSWGGGNYSSALHEAIVYSYNNKVSFVAAAGNSGSNIDANPTYPASYGVPNVIAVSATNDYDSLASFSNFGALKVHLASPGVGIYSTYPNNLYASLSGTSMAAPFVAGVVAIMNREQQTMNGYQLKQLLLTNVDSVSGLYGTNQTNGRVNALNSLISAKAASVDPYQPEYSMSLSGNDRGLASNLVTNGAGCGTVSKLYKQYNDNQTRMTGSPNITLNLVLVIILIAIPFALAITLKTNSQHRRRWDRFKLGSKVYVETIDGEFLGSVGTISMGGLELKSQQLLKHGDQVRMVIESPDGKEYVEVHGKVVWSNERVSYGISFVEAREQSLVTINQWTKGLSKA